MPNALLKDALSNAESQDILQRPALTKASSTLWFCPYQGKNTRKRRKHAIDFCSLPPYWQIPWDSENPEYGQEARFLLAASTRIIMP